MPVAELERRLLDGTLDFSILPHRPEGEGVRSAAVMREDLCAFLPRTHPLTGRSSLSLAELDGETFFAVRRHRVLARRLQAPHAARPLRHTGRLPGVQPVGAHLSAAELRYGRIGTHARRSRSRVRPPRGRRRACDVLPGHAREAGKPARRADGLAGAPAGAVRAPVRFPVDFESTPRSTIVSEPI
ncbi:LysR substrate-binding domain-containing protein [Gordonibacter urolithinfaciens]